MKNVLVFAGSNSKRSINKQLAVYTAGLLTRTGYTVVDLNDYPAPVFGVDLEAVAGIPDNIAEFNNLIENHDGFIVSLAEHNGSYAAVFKNLFDWLSRINAKVWRGKPMLLMSTSPGGRGGAGVLEAAQTRFPRNGGNIAGVFSLPDFKTHFSNNMIISENYNSLLTKMVKEFEDSLEVDR